MIFGAATTFFVVVVAVAVATGLGATVVLVTAGCGGVVFVLVEDVELPLATIVGSVEGIGLPSLVCSFNTYTVNKQIHIFISIFEVIIVLSYLICIRILSKPVLFNVLNTRIRGVKKADNHHMQTYPLIMVHSKNMIDCLLSRTF